MCLYQFETSYSSTRLIQYTLLLFRTFSHFEHDIFEAIWNKNVSIISNMWFPKHSKSKMFRIPYPEHVYAFKYFVRVSYITSYAFFDILNIRLFSNVLFSKQSVSKAFRISVDRATVFENVSKISFTKHVYLWIFRSSTAYQNI